MEKTREIKYQIIKVTVPEPGATVNINVTSDRIYKKITGILMCFPFYAYFTQRSSMSLFINDKEIFPEEFDVKLVAYGVGLAPNDMFYLLDEEAAGSTVKARFKDGGDTMGFPYPYTANFYLRLEEKS